MAKISGHLIICCVLTCLWLTAPVDAIDDFDPGDHDDAWWNTNGSTYTLKCLDSDDKYKKQDTKFVEVSTALKDSHCKDSDGVKRKHVHFKDDYDDTAEGNRFWDYMFMEGESERPTRVSGSNATNKHNCYSWTLKNVIAKGTYNYWINRTPAKNALGNDADEKNKTDVQADDVLFYYNNDHMTAVVSVSGSEPNHLKWKYATSGLYELLRETWETPRCDDVTLTVGQKIDPGNWDWDEIGDESNLYPTNKVWRKEP